MKRRKFLVFVMIIISSFLLSSCKEEVSFVTGGTVNKKSDSIIVDIKGAVVFPGIYSVSESALIIDVIRLAGGLLDCADVKKINFATPVESNQMIVIPQQVISNEVEEENKLININTSTLFELTALPGIGEVKAQNIIDYRDINGKFTSLEQLKNVSGISETVYNKIKTMVTL